MLGLPRDLWDWLECVFTLCVCERGHGREKETEYSVQRLIRLCNSTAAHS